MLRCRPSEVGLALEDLDAAFQRIANRKGPVGNRCHATIRRAVAHPVGAPRICPGAQRSRDDAITNLRVPVATGGLQLLAPSRAEIVSDIDGRNQFSDGTTNFDSTASSSEPDLIASSQGLDEQDVGSLTSQRLRRNAIGSRTSSPESYGEVAGTTRGRAYFVDEHKHRFSAPPFSPGGASLTHFSNFNKSLAGEVCASPSSLSILQRLGKSTMARTVWSADSASSDVFSSDEGTHNLQSEIVEDNSKLLISARFSRFPRHSFTHGLRWAKADFE